MTDWTDGTDEATDMDANPLTEVEVKSGAARSRIDPMRYLAYVRVVSTYADGTTATGHLSAKEARDHASELLGASLAAEGDAFLYQFAQAMNFGVRGGQVLVACLQHWRETGEIPPEFLGPLNH